jgi:hypothetical protein
MVFFGDRLTESVLAVKGILVSLLELDGSAIRAVLGLAQRLGVNLTP